jgi:hypothetical protein
MELTVVKIWDLFEHRHLFRARNPKGKLDDGYHLAEMQALLGDPPLEFLARSERSLEFWDENGSCSFLSGTQVSPGTVLTVNFCIRQMGRRRFLPGI